MRTKRKGNKTRQKTKPTTTANLQQILVSIMCCEDETQQAIFSWKVYFISAKETGNPELPTAMSTLHLLLLLLCPFSSLIISTSGLLLLNRLTHWT